ncbi:MAG: hypothetical protein GX819_05960 [Clostridiaceae bacterium]|nr:hypothetical protein [Clostridiaceae bacterium]
MELADNSCWVMPALMRAWTRAFSSIPLDDEDLIPLFDRHDPGSSFFDPSGELPDNFIVTPKMAGEKVLWSQLVDKIQSATIMLIT